MPAFAVSDPREMLKDPQQEARAEAVGRQLRCLVCQSESIEESDSMVARDLRRIVREHIQAGETDTQIIDWVAARYGSFVRLKPPLNPVTIVLWGMPLLALLAGGLAIFLGSRAKPQPPTPLTAQEAARLEELSRPA